MEKSAVRKAAAKKAEKQAEKQAAPAKLPAMGQRVEVPFKEASGDVWYPGDVIAWKEQEVLVHFGTDDEEWVGPKNKWRLAPALAEAVAEPTGSLPPVGRNSRGGSLAKVAKAVSNLLIHLIP